MNLEALDCYICSRMIKALRYLLKLLLLFVGDPVERSYSSPQHQLH